MAKGPYLYQPNSSDNFFLLPPTRWLKIYEKVLSGQRFIDTLEQSCTSTLDKKATKYYYRSSPAPWYENSKLFTTFPSRILLNKYQAIWREKKSVSIIFLVQILCLTLIKGS